MTNPQAIVDLTHEVKKLAIGKIGDINDINREATFLALNALIEAARAGDAGKGFAVVANQVKHVSRRIGDITEVLNKELAVSLARLTELGDSMIDTMHAHQGQRCADLALNMIDIIDRNLYERSCDVRWWATDSAIVDCVENECAEATAHASERLSVILDSYTVYKDLWVVDARGVVIASGRGERYPVLGKNVGDARWFKSALATTSGAEYVASDIEALPWLQDAHVATFSTAIRTGGRESGRVQGALVIFFDWAPQAETVVKGVRLSDQEWAASRCLIVDSSCRVIASSDSAGLLREHFPLNTEGKQAGFYRDRNGATVSFAATPGYETYKGLGWYGVICQQSAKSK